MSMKPSNLYLKDNFYLLEQALNYKFNNSKLLAEALTHPSMKQVDPKVKDYERLEFLGDSILGFLVTEMIFKKYKDVEEGDLAKVKAHLVSSEILVHVADKLGLSKYLIINHGEEKSGGRSNTNNIENSMEALIAAIYLDSNIENVRKIVRFFWKNIVDDINFDAVDPKSSLQEIVQKNESDLPQYEVISRKGPVHAPLFKVKVSSVKYSEIATGKSIKEAEKKAAHKLINNLKKLGY